MFDESIAPVVSEQKAPEDGHDKEVESGLSKKEKAKRKKVGNLIKYHLTQNVKSLYIRTGKKQRNQSAMP